MDAKNKLENAVELEAEIYRLYPECRPKKGKTYPIDMHFRMDELVDILKRCLVDEKERKYWFTAHPHPVQY